MQMHVLEALRQRIREGAFKTDVRVGHNLLYDRVPNMIDT